MSPYSKNERLDLFRNLFKGREDVFAIRWEKPASTSGGGNKSGYMPAYQYDPYMYRLHTMKGGTFKDYTNKTYRPLTDQQLLKHFNGEQCIGMYPLLQDNTSWFIAADFDKAQWADEYRTFLTFVQHTKNNPLQLQPLRPGNTAYNQHKA